MKLLTLIAFFALLVALAHAAAVESAATGLAVENKDLENKDVAIEGQDQDQDEDDNDSEVEIEDEDEDEDDDAEGEFNVPKFTVVKPRKVWDTCGQICDGKDPCRPPCGRCVNFTCKK